MSDTLDKGKKGEDIAARHLTGAGYRILERNWQSGHRELDIIACKNNTLVIVEVKARSSSFFGEPQEFVTRKKQQKLIAAANHYLVSHAMDLEVRFDIIAICFEEKGHRLEHIEHAFYPV